MSVAGWGDDSSFIVDRGNWAMIARIRPDGLLRITYGDVPGLTREEYIARQPMKYKAILPGHPDPDKYKVKSINNGRRSYGLDASFWPQMPLISAIHCEVHLLSFTSPLILMLFSGGLGLTGGIVDIGNLFDCFVGIPMILSMPPSWIDTAKLWQEADTADQDPFFKVLADAQDNPELTRQLQEGLYKIMYDFRKEYKIQPDDTINHVECDAAL